MSGDRLETARRLRLKFEESRDPRVKELASGEPDAGEMAALLAAYAGAADPESIDVRFLAPGRSGAKVFLITHIHKLPVIVKVGARPNLEREVRNYSGFELEETLPQELRPTLKYSGGSDDYALIVYSWAGGWERVKSFRDFFTDSGAESVVRVTESLMADMFRWHRPTKAANLPFDQWSWDEMTLKTVRRAVDSWPVGEEDKSRVLAALEGQRRWRDALATKRGSRAVCHGDLNCNNILLAGTGGATLPKLIDFASVTGSSSPARDWAKFEREVKIRCLRELIPDPAEYADALTRLDVLSDCSEYSGDHRVSKACQVIATVRRGYEERMSNISDIPRIEYFYYLLCWTLAYLANQDGSDEPLVVRNAILKSALGIIERLDAECAGQSPTASAAPRAAPPPHPIPTDDDIYLQIPPPGGDILHKIESEFDRLTAQALTDAVVEIAGLAGPLARSEVSNIEDQLEAGKHVLLTGEAGTGKSGVGVLLARTAQAGGRYVLLIDARRLGHVRSENDFRNHFNLKGPVEEAVAQVADKRRCLVIIDQFDNAARTPAAEFLTRLALACYRIKNTETVVISRKVEYHEEESLKKLVRPEVVELTSHQLTEVRVVEILEDLGIKNAPRDLIEVCRNLLNLSLVATIKAEKPTYDFSTTLDEVELWEAFIAALAQEEGVGVQPDFGELVVEHAVRLAGEALCKDDRSVVLERPRPPVQRRLDSWQVLIREEEDIYHFRHERMQDFLVAKGAVRRGTLPGELLQEFDKHRLRGVFAWMDKLYARRPDSARRDKFLTELFTSGEMPFYALAEVLQRYIKASDPAADAVALPIILEALRTNEGLRAYFFGSGPHPQWAPVLWDEGFFNDPPSPQPFGDRHVLPPWYEQHYLISISALFPALLIKHLNHLRSDSGYVEQTVWALRQIAGEQAELAVPRLLQWLHDYGVGQTIVSAVVDLIKRLAVDERTGAALELFGGLTAPHPSPRAQQIEGIEGYVFAADAVALFSTRGGFAHKELPELVRSLSGIAPKEVVEILENHLLEAVRLESETRKLHHAHVWESWIDPLSESRGIGDEYKYILLRTLRQTLSDWADTDAGAVRTVIGDYLAQSRSTLEGRSILRRLAVYLLQKYPERYPDMVSKELLDPESLNTLAPKDEFLMLLRKGHRQLKDQDRESLIERISRGLPPEVIAQFEGQSEQDGATEQDQFFQRHEKTWVRDHLAALRDSLSESQTRLLTELTAEVGEPITPGAPQATYQPPPKRENSAITQDRLAAMSPDALVNFVRDWEPQRDEDGVAFTSYEPLTDMVAEQVLLNPARYGEAINLLAVIRHQFAAALISRLTNTARYPLSWEGRVALCENLLADENARTDVSKHTHGGWAWVRLSVVRLIATWVDKRLLPAPVEYLPPDYFVRVRNILLELCDDPDPEPDETMQEGGLREKQVALIAHGHARPSALSTLILYAVYKTQLESHDADNNSSGVDASSRLEQVVRETLTRKLDREADPSWAVHSVYGEHLRRMYWLDRQWVDEQLERIFPVTDDERLRWYFVAAWDSYISHNGWEAFFNRSGVVSLNLFERMRRNYVRAIENLSAGWVTRSSPQPPRDIVAHLLIEYLHADYDLRSEEGQQSLIAQFYRSPTPSAFADAAWVLWHICSERRGSLDYYWKRAHALWAWRVGEASSGGHQIACDDEMNWFALLLHLAGKRETLASLWPLLEGMIPHVARSGRHNNGWNDVEKYLAEEVTRDPVRAIKLYYLMLVEYKESLWMFYPREEGHRIVQTALASPEAEREAKEMINFLARHLNYRFSMYLK